MPSHSETPLSIRFVAAAFAIRVIFSAAPVLAHHGSGISYDLSKTVAVKRVRHDHARARRGNNPNARRCLGRRRR